MKEEPQHYDEFCKVCGRVRWGNWQPLAFEHWRHEECYPGSQNWLEWFKGLSKSQQTEEGKRLQQWATTKGGGT